MECTATESPRQNSYGHNRIGLRLHFPYPRVQPGSMIGNRISSRHCGIPSKKNQLAALVYVPIM